MTPPDATNRIAFASAELLAGVKPAAALEWIDRHQAILWWFGSASVVVFVIGILLVPMAVVRIPPQYFNHDTRPANRWATRHPVVRSVVRVLRNILGIAFLLAGLAMLLLPGQIGRAHV